MYWPNPWRAHSCVQRAHSCVRDMFHCLSTRCSPDVPDNFLEPNRATANTVHFTRRHTRLLAACLEIGHLRRRKAAHHKVQAARVQRVSEARGCFCNFAAGELMLAKSSKFRTGVATAAAKIRSRTNASRSSKEGRIDLRRRLGCGESHRQDGLASFAPRGGVSREGLGPTQRAYSGPQVQTHAEGVRAARVGRAGLTGPTTFQSRVGVFSRVCAPR